MKCPKCGYENKDGALHCDLCKEILHGEQTLVTPLNDNKTNKFVKFFKSPENFRNFLIGFIGFLIFNLIVHLSAKGGLVCFGIWIQALIIVSLVNILIFLILLFIKKTRIVSLGYFIAGDICFLVISMINGLSAEYPLIILLGIYLIHEGKSYLKLNENNSKSKSFRTKIRTVETFAVLWLVANFLLWNLCSKVNHYSPFYLVPVANSIALVSLLSRKLKLLSISIIMGFAINVSFALVLPHYLKSTLKCYPLLVAFAISSFKTFLIRPLLRLF